MSTRPEFPNPKTTKSEPAHVPAADSETAGSVEPGDERSDEAEEVSELDPQQIAVLAYQYWEERGRPANSPEQDWFQAEETLYQERKKT